MKKTIKFFSIVLAVIMLFSMFSIVSSAANLTDRQIVELYDVSICNVLKADVWKTGVPVKVVEEVQWTDVADFSGVSFIDEMLTKAENKSLNGKTSITNFDWYLEASDASPSTLEIYYATEIGYFEPNEYKIENASYKKNKDGTQNVSFQIVIGDSISEYSAVINKNKCAQHIECSNVYNDIVYSHYGKEIPVKSYVSEKCDIVHNEVSAKTLELEKTEIKLGYKDVAKIKYTITPTNVTFEDVGCELEYCYHEATGSYPDPYNVVDIDELNGEDGTITIKALGEGAAYVNVYTYSGNSWETITVTVEYSFFDRIQIFFEDLFADFKNIFA